MIGAPEMVNKSVSDLRNAGHRVEVQIRGDRGTQWFEVDRRMLVSWEEMQELAKGTYTIEELESEFKQHAEANPATAEQLPIAGPKFTTKS